MWSNGFCYFHLIRNYKIDSLKPVVQISIEYLSIVRILLYYSFIWGGLVQIVVFVW